MERGIILADTKFEFGRIAGESTPLLVDEIFTPDSSRFWPADQWRPGGEQPSFDKQYVRDYLETLVKDGRWDKTPPGPTLPDDVVKQQPRALSRGISQADGIRRSTSNVLAEVVR